MSGAQASTYAAAICAQIERRSEELARLGDAATTASSEVVADSWSPREVVLHLIGGVSDLPDHIADALREKNPYIEYGQPGGEYIDDPSIETAQTAIAVLRQHLDVISAAVRDLDDAELRRTVTMAAGDGQASVTVSDTPVGSGGTPVSREAFGKRLTLHEFEHERLQRRPG